MSTMFLVLPVPFRWFDGQLHVEAQAANGLDRWADHFDRVTVAAPLLPDDQSARLAGVVWRPVASLEHAARVVCQPLPWAYTPGAFARTYRQTRRLLAQSVQDADHLQFAIGGLLGDWAAVAALEAGKQGRNYAIHTDRVEHEVMRKTAASGSLARRLKIAVEAPLMKRYHRRVIERCSLGLWHGEECYRAYSPWCGENHLIHDVHTKAGDLICDAELTAKTEDLRGKDTLRICYAGRLDAMKAPLEWLSAIAAARDAGVQLRATWFGEGPMLDEAVADRQRLGLEEIVDFAGFVADRAILLQAVRQAHMLVFTHVTPESPRNLLEALVSGTPIVGYDNPYAVDLIAEHGGGALVPLHDTHALGELIAALDGDRDRLGAMTLAAAKNGRRFTDAGVFAERSDLIKRYA